ncbi:GD13652 [Drosophila simulans]|uniref:GD13652 n=1 Tax=Drosophila simulans TaxID=7240 RepID=B4QMZ1_DROSI|nr:GD13652 [Drosophila simulans]
MLTPCLLLVATVASFSLHAQAIRVDWGTNTGPIPPPPPRTTPHPPRKPYRDPAPVWEDQSDDVPNPNPYVYVLPPPSRPRTWAIPAGPYAPPNYNNLPPKGNNYGQLASNSYSGGVTSVPGLAAQYVPGVGIKYTAIVPDKLQGKYNAKTKKYKAYEKAKYAYPWNYLQQLPVEEKALEWQAELEKRLDEEQAQSRSQALSSSTTSTTSSTSTATSTTTTPAPLPSADSTTTAASTTTSTSTQQPTTIANYKLAHEKSAHLKKHSKQKKLLQLHMEQEKKALKKLQQGQNSLQTS